jgi:hypothetical protein
MLCEQSSTRGILSAKSPQPGGESMWKSKTKMTMVTLIWVRYPIIDAVVSDCIPWKRFLEAVNNGVSWCISPVITALTLEIAKKLQRNLL